MLIRGAVITVVIAGLTACASIKAAQPVKSTTPPATTQLLAPPPSTAPTPTRVVATPADPRQLSSRKPLEYPLSFGLESPLVRELQLRLRHARYFAEIDVTDHFGWKTLEGVKKFQTDHQLPVTGSVDQGMWDVLLPKSYDPTPEELSNREVGPWFTGPANPGFMMEVQHRLRQLGHYSGQIHGNFDQASKDGIAAFRQVAGLAAGTVLDERAWVLLRAQTHNPSYTELFATPPAVGDLTQELDPRCMSGKVICVNREQKRLSYVVDGKIALTREARFARPGWESPKGDFQIWHKNLEVVSDIFGERTPMPYAMFFNYDRALHFSDAFADTGYESGSHGCTQLRDYQAMKWLYDQLDIGDRVLLY